MKVFLPAIAGHVPPQMVRAIAAFIDFCYLVRRSVISEDTLRMVEMALKSFHRDREIFRDSGVRPSGFSLPRQHSIMHYRHLIQQFGAPNGLCSSITESKHIVAVKKPWRRSNKHKALGQMLLANQRMDKLAAMKIHIQTIGTDRQHGVEGGEGEESDENEEVEEGEEGEEDEEGREDEEDEMSGVDDGPHSHGEVSLAKTRGMQYSHSSLTGS
jgi:hypothetical protein